MISTRLVCRLTSDYARNVVVVDDNSLVLAAGALSNLKLDNWI